MTTMAPHKDLATLVFMVANNKPFNFENLVYDQIIASANAKPTYRLVLPNLIDQFLRYQCIVPSYPDDHSSAVPLTFKLEKKNASLYGIPLDPKDTSLAGDLKHLARLIRGMQLKLSGMISVLIYFTMVGVPLMFLPKYASKQVENMAQPAGTKEGKELSRLRRRMVTLSQIE